MLQEPEAEPKDYIGIYIPRLKLGGVDAAIGADGAMTETLTFEAGMKPSAAGQDQAMITFTTSAS